MACWYRRSHLLLFLYAAAWLVSETLFLFLWVIGLIQLVWFVQSHQSSRIVLAGILFGLATLVRPATLLAVGVWSGLGAILLKPMRVWLLLGLVTLATLLPWTVRNWLVFKSFILVSTNGGYVFYGANNAEAIGGQREGFPPWLPHLSEPERDRTYIHQGLTWITENPDRFLMLLPQKLMRLWSPLSISSADQPLTTPFDGVLYPFWIAFLLLSGLGGVLTFRHNTQIALVLTVPILATCLTALIFFGSTRYAQPMVPSLLIFAAFALDRFRSHLQGWAKKC